MASKIFMTLFILLTTNLKASTFFFPDGDTAALITLVSNTASTVSNTMKILEVAKKTSDQIDRYNSIAMRRFYMARRIEQHVRDIAEAGKMNPKGLKEINRMLLRLKTNLSGLKSNIDFLAKDVFEAEDFTNRYWERLNNSKVDEKEASGNEIISSSAGSMSKHVQNTAINTALTAKVLTKKRRDDLEYQKIDLGLKKSEAVEKLRREEFYKSWAGVHKND